jgi:putative NADH-flavin reductase
MSLTKAIPDAAKRLRPQWTYISPDAGRIRSGERTGRYRVGGDQILPPRPGAEDLSAEDLAVALVDEIEVSRHLQRRFAVGN